MPGQKGFRLFEDFDDGVSFRQNYSPFEVQNKPYLCTIKRRAIESKFTPSPKRRGFILEEWREAILILPSLRGEPICRLDVADRKSTRLNSSHQLISYA